MNERPMFDAALDIPDPDERQAFLPAACAEVPPLIPRIEALLSAHQGIGFFLENQVIPPWEKAATMPTGEAS